MVMRGVEEKECGTHTTDRDSGGRHQRPSLAGIPRLVLFCTRCG